MRLRAIQKDLYDSISVFENIFLLEFEQILTYRDNLSEWHIHSFINKKFVYTWDMHGLVVKGDSVSRIEGAQRWAYENVKKCSDCELV